MWEYIGSGTVTVSGDGYTCNAFQFDTFFNNYGLIASSVWSKVQNTDISMIAASDTIDSGDAIVDFGYLTSAPYIGIILELKNNHTFGDTGNNADYAISVYNQSSIYYLTIWENGVNKGTFTNNWSYYNRFKIAIESGVVKYYKDSTLLYTSLQAPTYPLRPRIRNGGGALGNCGITVYDQKINNNPISWNYDNIKTYWANNCPGWLAYHDAGYHHTGIAHNLVWLSGNLKIDYEVCTATLYAYHTFGLKSDISSAGTGATVKYGFSINIPTTPATINAQCVENGVGLGTTFNPVIGDILSIRIESGVVKFYRNNVLLQTAISAPVAILYPFVCNNAGYGNLGKLYYDYGIDYLEAYIALGTGILSGTGLWSWIKSYLMTGAITTYFVEYLPEAVSIVGSGSADAYILASMVGTNFPTVTVMKGAFGKNTRTDTWDCDARSYFEIPNSSIEYILELLPIYIAQYQWGVSTKSLTPRYSNINFSFYTNGTTYYIYESGIMRLNLGNLTNPVLKIKIGTDNIVRYYNGESLLYTSGVTPTYPLVMEGVAYSWLNGFYNGKINGQYVDWIALNNCWDFQEGFVFGNGGGASSLQYLSSDSDGYVEWELFPQNYSTQKYRVGLARFDRNNLGNVEFGFEISGGTGFKIVESGNYPYIDTTSALAWHDKFKVSYEGSQVKYYYKDSLVYTSVYSPTYPAEIKIYNMQGGYSYYFRNYRLSSTTLGKSLSDPIVYVVNGSGGISTSGSAITILRYLLFTASGGIITSGNAITAYYIERLASGYVATSGAAGVLGFDFLFLPDSGGSVVASGTGLSEWIIQFLSSGFITIAEEEYVPYIDYPFIGYGQIIISGELIREFNLSYIAQGGGVTFSGAAYWGQDWMYSFIPDAEGGLLTTPGSCLKEIIIERYAVGYAETSGVADVLGYEFLFIVDGVGGAFISEEIYNGYLFLSFVGDGLTITSGESQIFLLDFLFLPTAYGYIIISGEGLLTGSNFTFEYSSLIPFVYIIGKGYYYQLLTNAEIIRLYAPLMVSLPSAATIQVVDDSDVCMSVERTSEIIQTINLVSTLVIDYGIQVVSSMIISMLFNSKLTMQVEKDNDLATEITMTSKIDLEDIS